jgi:hypothetical protein
MIATEFYRGQGFGNQLWVYASTRCISIQNEMEYSILGSGRFKGSAFLQLPFGKLSGLNSARFPTERYPKGLTHYQKETLIREPNFSFDVSGPDPKFFDLSSHTLIDGNLQSLAYIQDFQSEIQDWFQVSGEFFDGCVINFRGGEYKGIRNVLLPKEYYYYAIEMMRKTDPRMKFLVVTDDSAMAKSYFPDFPIMSSGGVKIIMNRVYISPPSSRIGRDFGQLQNARYLILSNSSFSWWGAWSSKSVRRVIAPKYWAAHNVSNGFWSTGDIAEPSWEWIPREDYED